jgi:hypothetical protein
MNSIRKNQLFLSSLNFLIEYNFHSLINISFILAYLFWSINITKCIILSFKTLSILFAAIKLNKNITKANKRMQNNASMKKNTIT